MSLYWWWEVNIQINKREEKDLVYSRMSSRKCRPNDRVTKLPVCNHHSNWFKQELSTNIETFGPKLLRGTGYLHCFNIPLHRLLIIYIGKKC